MKKINICLELLLLLIFIIPIYSQEQGTIQNNHPVILKPESFKHYVDYFNRMEEENIVNAIPDSEAWDWMRNNIPFFECPQDNFEEIYYYRWWSLRKHIVKTPAGYAMTEFLVNRSYADKYNLISCAFGHHIYESRWLHNQKYLDDYIHVWYRGNKGKPMKKFHSFSSWAIDAIYNKYLVDDDKKFLLNMLPDLESDYAVWENERKLPNGLFWQYDVNDGMEESISGGRKVKNMRPTINSYMYGIAEALAKIEKIAGRNAQAEKYLEKADTIKNLIQNLLWNPDDEFFETRESTNEIAGVREEIGFLPWYFNLPDSQYNIAWKQVYDPEGFLAPFGITTAERRSPQFRTHGCCNCEWDGAVWPFATSQTLTALANFLNNYRQSALPDSIYFKLLELYVESQYYRGRPYIGEYLDEKTGYWLKGDQERSRYYNHSTFCDLIITGLIGLRPRADNILEINPLVPQNKWSWFCLDNIFYHGKIITIFWDKTGNKYKHGKGFHILVNGKEVISSPKIEKISVHY